MACKAEQHKDLCKNVLRQTDKTFIDGMFFIELACI